MSHSLNDYGRMLRDSVRRDAYLRVIDQCAPGARVLDLGCGTGFFSLHAAKAGASHVVAVDTNEAVKLLPKVVKQNDMVGKVESFHGDIRELDCGKFDLILADLRGPTPFLGEGLAVMNYAAEELLAEGGVLTPAADSLQLALVSAPDWHNLAVYPWRLDDLEWSFYEKRILSTPVQIASLAESSIMGSKFEWCYLDYSDSSSLNKKRFGGNAVVTTNADGLSHGIACWFETRIADGIAFSTAASNHAPTYGRLLLPFEAPVEISNSMEVTVSVKCHRVMGNWVWEWGLDTGQKSMQCSSLDVAMQLPG